MLGSTLVTCRRSAVSFTSKTDRHDITLDVESGVKHQSIQSNCRKEWLFIEQLVNMTCDIANAFLTFFNFDC